MNRTRQSAESKHRGEGETQDLHTQHQYTAYARATLMEDKTSALKYASVFDVGTVGRFFGIRRLFNYCCIQYYVHSDVWSNGKA